MYTRKGSSNVFNKDNIFKFVLTQKKEEQILQTPGNVPLFDTNVPVRDNIVAFRAILQLFKYGPNNIQLYPTKTFWSIKYICHLYFFLNIISYFVFDCFPHLFLLMGEGLFVTPLCKILNLAYLMEKGAPEIS